MSYEKDERRLDTIEGKLEAIKRRASNRPRYVPADIEQVTLNYLNIFRLVPTEGDYVLKKQKLDGWTAPSEDEVTLDMSEIDIDRVVSPNGLESRRSNSLESISDRVFSSPSSPSGSSSRCSSPTRNSETNDSPNVDPREHGCEPASSEQIISQTNTVQARSISQSYWPTSISAIDQPAITVACVNVGKSTYRGPLISINGNHTKSNDISGVKPRSDDDNMDRSSFTSSISRTGSLPDAPSLPEAEGQSTEDDGSSQPSSHVSDTGATNRSENKKASHDDELEAFIKNDVLRTDPDHADLFYQAIKDQLEYSAPEYPDGLEDSHEFSLLELLELEAFGLAKHSGAPTECPASSTGHSPKQSTTQHKTSTSSTGQRGSSGRSGPSRNADISQDDPNQLVKPAVKTLSSQHGRAHLFRCIHNAIAPAIFSVNEDTLEKYRACSGPGWNSISHLKEHMQKVHTKQVKKVNPLQCNRCQDEFSNQDELKGHELNVDCAIRCPDCSDVFSTKALRQEHQKENHFEESNDDALRELDDAMWKQIKDSLKLYADSFKNKKGKVPSDPDAERERWVIANTPRYEAGRSDTKFNSKLELGQWYTIFTTLAPNMKILDHPFYDYGTPRSDYAEERILLINEKMIDTRVQAHGKPPANFDLQRAWYREALRDSLRVAAKTKTKKDPHNMKGDAPPRRNNTLAPSPGPGPSTVGGMGYVSTATTPQVPHTPVMNSNVINMALMPPGFHPSTPQYGMQPQWGINATMPDTSHSMAINPAQIPVDFQFAYGSPTTMTDSNGQSFAPTYNFLGQSNQNDFDSMGGNTPNWNWQNQQGGP